MSAKQGAIVGAAFGGAGGGLLAGGLAQYLCGDGHYLPLVAGSVVGTVIAGLFGALVTRNSLCESSPEHAHDDR